jgi:valyl-tRNA synthetase
MMKPFIEKLGKVEELTFVETKLENSVTDVSDNLETFISTDDVDMSAIIGKLTKQKEKLEKEIAKLNGMLNNERFVANAPEKVIAENREALSDAMEKMAKVEEELKTF